MKLCQASLSHMQKTRRLHFNVILFCRSLYKAALTLTSFLLEKKQTKKKNLELWAITRARDDYYNDSKKIRFVSYGGGGSGIDTNLDGKYLWAPHKQKLRANAA